MKNEKNKRYDNKAGIICFLLIGLLMCFCHQASAQCRIIQSINSNWQFYKGDKPTDGKAIEWTNVSLPHSFNSHDVCDDEPGYYRGPTWYRKTIYVPDSWKDKDTYLFFEGVAEVATVYVNGKYVGQHIGSFTAFDFKLNDYLQWDGNGANEVTIKVDNSHNEDIPPLSADFTFYGGIYRDVYLSVINPVHFDADNKASKGVFITTPLVNNDKAVVDVRGVITNSSTVNRQVEVNYTITDKEGKPVARESQQLTIAASGKLPFEHTFKGINKPNLWSPENPYLYKLSAVITDANTKEVLDEEMNPLGFRWFEFTADRGFFLNGKHYKLWGTSRHQDNMNIGNALPDALHVKDIQLLKDLGANFLRVAHYPQDPAVLEACDRLGILTSVETPIVNAITETEAFSNNCLNMQVEMIRQNFNHPSIIIWGYMNEVLLRLRYTDDKPRQQTYFANVRKLASSIDSISRLEDPSRYTMIPFHGDLDLYIRTGMAQIPQVVGWNQYSGWYSGRIESFAENLDRHRRLLPNKPMIVTEFGADGDPRLRSFSPERFDKTLEYETYFHQVYVKAIRERDFVSGASMWTLADFNAEGRAEAMPHINNKGLLTMDRKPKDVYLYYQSQLLKEPFIRIGSRSWTLRSATEDSDGAMVCTQPVQVFSNQPSVTMTANGKTLGTTNTTDGIAVFNVPFVDGNNKLEVATTVNGKTYKDEVGVRFLLLPVDLRSTKTPFKEINISLGDKRFFTDDNLQHVWLPEKSYTPGNWG